ncbi:shikimate dehydrogenase [Paramicrobacterium agarici]|nr:shikimate dehydrogenase [Microbacterium agarici]
MLMRDRLAVLGSPIAHSQSPALHSAAYRVMGRPWSYDRIEMREHELTAFLNSADAAWRGLSLTMPLKKAAFAASETLDDDARLTGVVNTLRLNDGPVAGFNTDVEGIVRAVGAAGSRAPDAVLVLGGGATAASALVAAGRLGASHVEIAVRAPAKAQRLFPLAHEVGVELAIRELSSSVVASHADVIVSTLPGGSDAAEQYTADTRRHALLFDVAYSPWPSAVARAWHDVDGSVINGLAMLVHQALLQVRVFASGSPDVVLDDEQHVLAAMLDAVHLEADGRA